MLQYRMHEEKTKDVHNPNSVAQPTNRQTRAAFSIASGFSSLRGLASDPTGLTHRLHDPASRTVLPADQPRPETVSVEQRELAARDYVKSELRRYREDGLDHDTSIMAFWTVSCVHHCLTVSCQALQCIYSAERGRVSNALPCSDGHFALTSFRRPL